ncbi:hypothetical protein SSP24_50300 [Streptomyces spinoverrucosus]|uniref:Uncharacterized protein n=1 Tax=Streptomyces spinoverrucosus TaxID=284043 RepID=A0A4Y3VML1_9ACTN|nr:hypothetical protein SSP24_50300 [Streptomyces spinoverrucosus]GHB55030.1 hypothetical protein GCM10010397_26750 [Streptomyces spinoverrucosus]
MTRRLARKGATPSRPRNADADQRLNHFLLSAVRVIAPPSPTVLAHEAFGGTTIISNAESTDGRTGTAELDAHLPVEAPAACPTIVVCPCFDVFL